MISQLLYLELIKIQRLFSIQSKNLNDSL